MALLRILARLRALQLPTKVIVEDLMASVLHVSDIAGVGANLRAALEAHTPWSAVGVDLRDVDPRRRRAVHGMEMAMRYLSAPSIVRRAVADLQPDVVHLHWARFAPVMPNGARPLVVHAHGSDVRDRLGGPYGRLIRRALERADAVIAATPDLLDFLPPAARVLPGPIDVDFFSPSPVVRVRPNRPVVLIFARLTDIKGGRILVEFARRLLRRRPDVEVRAIRGGSFDAQAQAAGVRMFDPTDRVGVRRHLCNSDIVVGQQRLGTLGLSELEAMSCGRPVIAKVSDRFRIDGAPVISTTQVEHIVNNCEALLEDNNLRAALGSAGRNFVIAQHHPAVVARLLGEIYRTLE